MKEKWTLFVGILLLTLGIVLKKTTNLDSLSILLMVSGVMFKSYYIIDKIRSGKYNPGWEFGMLFAGLALFLSGLYFRAHNAPFNPLLLIFSGISLKVIFVIVFIIKIRKGNSS